MSAIQQAPLSLVFDIEPSLQPVSILVLCWEPELHRCPATHPVATTTHIHAFSLLLSDSVWIYGHDPDAGKYSSPTSNMSIRRKWIIDYFDTDTSKNVKWHLLVPAKCDESLFFFVISDSNWRVFGFLTVCWIKKVIYGHYFGLWENVMNTFFKNVLYDIFFD